MTGDKAMLKLFAAVCLAAVACGCGVGKPLGVGERPELLKLAGQMDKDRKWPTEIRMVLISPSPETETKENCSARSSTASLQLEQSLREALASFEQTGLDISETSSEKPYFVMTLEISDFKLAFKGRNGVHGLNILWWWFSPWASWLVADENYSASLKVAVRVEDDTGKKVWSDALEIEVIKALDDYQRGTKWFSIYGIGELKEDNWRRIEETLRPHVVEEFQAKVLERLMSKETQTTLSAAVKEIKIRRLPVRNYAVVVGIDKCAQLGEKHPECCVSSAKLIGEFLKKAGWDEVVVLSETNLPAMKAALKKAGLLEEFRAGRLLFYYCGMGASEYKAESRVVEQYILDSYGEKLSLKELARLLTNIHADKRAIILDAGFMPDKLGRGVAVNDVPVGIAKFPEELIGGDIGFLSACAPDQGAAEIEEKGTISCLFTHNLLKAANNPASDINKDGMISLKEISESESIQFDLPRHSSMKCGMTQSPLLGKKVSDFDVAETPK